MKRINPTLDNFILKRGFTWRRKILLCVTGGIAAYKAVALTSKLTQNEFEVKVMMTENAMKFITPLTFKLFPSRCIYRYLDEKILPKSLILI